MALTEILHRFRSGGIQHATTIDAGQVTNYCKAQLRFPVNFANLANLPMRNLPENP
ncbi:hypothetical protein [Segniliparus rugosus]|uniref:hypothetical protein n=1 Tax=Segniliparus rugosus TaxID=286804 RepID=UPI0012EB744C|nr:hypothetical protein [Segniliparus rugosus]